MDDTVVIDTPNVLVRAGRLVSICLIGAWRGQRTALVTHLKTVLGVDVRADGCRATSFEGGTVFPVHPDKVLVIALGNVDLAQTLGTGWTADMGSLSDQSHGRIAITLSGAGVWDVLRQGLPLDPDHAMPGDGWFVQTRLGDANVLVHRLTHHSAMMLVPTSLAHSVSEWARRAAKNVIK